MRGVGTEENDCCSKETNQRREKQQLKGVSAKVGDDDDKHVNQEKP